jgi:hypothetical protein
LNGKTGSVMRGRGSGFVGRGGGGRGLGSSGVGEMGAGSDYVPYATGQADMMRFVFSSNVPAP